MYPTDRSTNSHQHDKKKIAIYDELKGLAKKIKRGVNGFETIHLTRAGLNAISTADGQLLLLSGSTPLPPESRIAINRYLSAGGNVIVVGDKGFDYAPQATDEVPLVKFSDRSSYQERTARLSGKGYNQSHNIT